MSHAYYEDTSEIADVIIESGTPLAVDAHVHHTSDSAPKLVEFSVSDQISRYLFVTLLIKDERVDSNVITSREPSESPRADYGSIGVPTESFSNDHQSSLI